MVSIYGKAKMCESYLCLHQVVSLVAYVHEEAEHIEAGFVCDLTHHAIYNNVCACSSHTSTETKDWD